RTSSATAIQSMPCSIQVLTKHRSGICQDQHSSEALLGRPFQRAGRRRLQPILTGTATRTTCSTEPAPVRQRYGISTITFLSAPRTAQLFRLVGVWSGSEQPLALIRA